MKINVRQKDIDNGICGDERKCALALAVSRAFNTKSVAVFYEPDSDGYYCYDNRDKNFLNLRIRVDNEYYSHDTIDKVEHCDNFIYWFDNGILGEDGCEPFKFEIDTTRTTI